MALRKQSAVACGSSYGKESGRTAGPMNAPMHVQRQQQHRAQQQLVQQQLVQQQLVQQQQQQQQVPMQFSMMQPPYPQAWVPPFPR